MNAGQILDEEDQNKGSQAAGDGAPGAADDDAPKQTDELEKIKAERAELEKKLSQMGEELSQKDAAINAYRRGEYTNPIPKQDPITHEEGLDDLPDPLENPKEFQKKVVQRASETAVRYVLSAQAAREAGDKSRERFFNSYPALKPYEDLVRYATQKFIHEHGGDPTMTEPRAFEAIAADVKKILGDKIDSGAKKQPPHFEPGSAAKPKAAEPKPNQEEEFASVEEAQAAAIKDYAESRRR